MNAELIILADDLSGAADCAAPFACAGYPTEVLLHLIPRADLSVTSIDLNTRDLTPDEAVRLTFQALQAIRPNQDTVWYRKIDSTLRGNIGREVAATLKGLSGKRVVLCAPAFPEAGRTTIHGKVLVHGKPLEESGVHSGWPQGKSISNLFSEVGLETRLLPLEVIRSGSSSILRHLSSNSGVSVAVCDAETNLDLLAIAEAGLRIAQEAIFVGSAGLAHQIAALWGSQPLLGNQFIVADKPILVVVGSQSPASRSQFDLLSNSMEMEILRLPVTALESENNPLLIAGLSRALANGRDVGLTTELDGLDSSQGARLMEVLGRVLRRFLPEFAALILTGGETARGILFQSEIGRLRVIDELEPGVILSIAGLKSPLPIVTKAGAFGTPATLLNAIHFLRSYQK